MDDSEHGADRAGRRREPRPPSGRPTGRPAGRPAPAQMLDELVEHAPFGIAAYDASPDYVCVRHNAPFLALVGEQFRRAGSVQGVPLRDLFDDASFRQVHAVFERVRTTGEVFSIEEFPAVLPPDPRPRYYKWSLTPVVERRRVRWLLLTAVEVTELVEARDVARASEQRYRSLTERAADGIFLTDRRGTILDVNQSGCDLLGWTCEDLVGRSIGDYIAPDELSSLPLRLGDLEDGGSLLTDRTLRRNDGSTVAVEVRSVVLADGSVLGIARDLTERRRVERAAVELARLARLLTETLDVEEVGRRTVESVVPLFGAAFSRLRLLEPDGSMRLIAWYGGRPGHVGVRALPENVGVAGRAVAERRPLWTPDVLRDPEFLLNDEARDVAASSGSSAILAVPLWSRGEIIGALTIGDRTGRRFTPDEIALLEAFGHQAAIALDNARLHQDALRRRAEAEAAVRARDEFLSVAAHELKTPLTSLRGFAQIGVRQLDTAGQLDPALARLALEGIDRQSDKLGRLVGRLLEVSRFDAGHFSLHREEADLVRLAAGVVMAARARAPGHDVALVAPSSVVAHVDPIRVDQIVTNLLDNAIRYSPRGQRISVELSTPTPDTIRLAVRDHGRGIDPEHRDRVFDRFFQAHARDHASGMGLGLYIGRQIAQAHGGDLQAEFPPDGGTLFVLTLPRG